MDQETLKTLSEVLKLLLPIITAIIGVVISWLVAKGMKIRADGILSEKARAAEIEAERQETERKAQYDKTVVFFRSEFGKALREAERLRGEVEIVNDRLDREQERSNGFETQITKMEQERARLETEHAKTIVDLRTELEGKIAQLSDELKARDQAKEIQDKALAKLEADVHKFQKENERLTTEKVARELELNLRANEVTALREEIRGLQERLNALEHPPTPAIEVVQPEVPPDSEPRSDETSI